MGFRERDDGWFTWWECEDSGHRVFRSPDGVCPECGAVTNMVLPPKGNSVYDYAEKIVKDHGIKIKTEKGTKRMKQENIYMLQYVAGALHGLSVMLGEADEDLKRTLSSLSEEVSNVVISETIDKEEEAKSKVSIYMDDGGDDGK